MGSLTNDWFEPVAVLGAGHRAKLEARGVQFEPEREPPFSTDAGPVSSTAFITDGKEFWLVADEFWKDGEFLPERSHDPSLQVEIRAAPEQFDSPADAITTFQVALGLQAEDFDWALPMWSDDTQKALKARRGR